MYEFIENLEDNSVEKFLDQLDDFKEGLRFDYDLVKNQLGYYGEDRECLITMFNIYNGSIKDGYSGFIWNEDIGEFYELNSEHINEHLIDYMKSSGLYSFEDLCNIISNDMSIDWFLDDISLGNSYNVKMNLARFFAEDIIYEVVSNFYDYFNKEIKELVD